MAKASIVIEGFESMEAAIKWAIGYKKQGQKDMKEYLEYEELHRDNPGVVPIQATVEDKPDWGLPWFTIRSSSMGMPAEFHFQIASQEENIQGVESPSKPITGGSEG